MSHLWFSEQTPGGFMRATALNFLRCIDLRVQLQLPAKVNLEGSGENTQNDGIGKI